MDGLDLGFCEKSRQIVTELMGVLPHERRSIDDLKEPTFGQVIDRLIDIACGDSDPCRGRPRLGAFSSGYALFCSGGARSPSFGMGFPLAINFSKR